ncbi:MAG: hemolysin family protein [Bacteroidia bacterium]|nr:hemolysin family protein [Bacteroidia bacterium]
MTLWLFIGCMALAFLLAGLEVVFLSSSRLKIELRLMQGSRSARQLSVLRGKPEEVLMGLRLLRTLAFTAAAAALAVSLRAWLQYLSPVFGPESPWSWILTVLIAWPLVFMLGEYVSGVIFGASPDLWIPFAGWLLTVIYAMTWLPVQLFQGLTRFVLRAFWGISQEGAAPAVQRSEAPQYLQAVIASGETRDTGSRLDTEMISNALALKETRVREFMIPRTELVAAPRDCPVPELLQLFIETRLSKILIYEDSLDAIQGYVHSHSLFTRPDSIDELIQTVIFVPENMAANTLLAEMTQNSRTVAIVVDEYGVTSGMVALEDLVEEVFGEIEDEYDTEPAEEEVEADLICRRGEQGEWLLGARLEIYDLNENQGLQLPESEYYTTLGGLILYHAERVPAPQERLRIGPYEVQILHAAPNRVISVRLQAAPAPPAA